MDHLDKKGFWVGGCPELKRHFRILDSKITRPVYRKFTSGWNNKEGEKTFRNMDCGDIYNFVGMKLDRLKFIHIQTYEHEFC